MPESTHTEQPDTPTPPVEVPLLLVLSLSIPAVAVVLYVMAQLWGSAERRAHEQARRVLEEAGEWPLREGEE